MGLENKKFKCKDDFTVYTLAPLQEDGYHQITWTHEDGSKDSDTWRGVTVEKKFSTGDWYFVNPIGGPLADVVIASPQEVEPKPDAVNHPKHYAVFEQLEAIEVIASSMTTEQFYGYCLGNILKYRLRAGGKDDVMQELGKADKYQELFTQFKYLCKDAA